MLKEASLLLGSFPMKDYIPRLSWVDKLSALNARVRKKFEMKIMLFVERRTLMEVEDIMVNLLILSMFCCHKTRMTGQVVASEWTRIEMFVTAIDTTYITIKWILAELITHPSVMSKAQEEVRRVLGSSQSVTV
ncbi:hypothetical protein IEQ34_012195 [Dendrobium chrysotoxum]|uniref:Cytochrome P450 n=1 Tax=Dendrobium chrysotoxum TaxID=161865 RepID=A0AAV7GTV7_DENCH|nr:hypothetical protein IEQ34_012195 [Dendrobium chrysotoxum]